MRDGISLSLKIPGTAYNRALQIGNGCELKPSATTMAPKVRLNGDQNSFYTLVMTDSDAPGHIEPTMREWLHWCLPGMTVMSLSLYSTIAWGASAHHGRGPGVSYGYPHFAISFIEAAVLNSVDGSSELGILEHYKLNTNVQSLTDPAVYPEGYSSSI
ncbi:hypothetical protein O6H91_09G041700 [Diphasiastrum complanatum]|uniref:Uncharacterized protein n=1 Tax=Diphasiastrum complanatum TaxID=34168 RepID=A0ACC2CNB5_DIPCM|nr:hypothetical protein O6H91_09G041700 [Diphasiastrum complanatum]